MREPVKEPTRHKCNFFDTYIHDGCFLWGVWYHHGVPVICAYLVDRGYQTGKTWPIYHCPDCGEKLPYYHLERNDSYPRQWENDGS